MDDFFCYWVEVSPSRPPASTIYRHGGAGNADRAQAGSRGHEDNGLGASAEGTVIEEFSFCFRSVLLGSGGLIDASSEETGTSTLVDTILSELTFAFFEGGGSISPSELCEHIQIISVSIFRDKLYGRRL
jgi:hypothetical protein